MAYSNLTMVVGLAVMSAPVDPTPSASAQLKFGMDRILSRELFIKNKEIRCLTSCLPECNSPALHCCSTSLAAPFYRQPLHVPQPVRPFTNIIIQSDLSSELSNNAHTQHRRKRSWSRAVFSNLQRKGLEKRFQLQKYITKPDRRQLAATLGLTDAQVKVWFQNRRMKWRHTKEGVREELTDGKGSESSLMSADSTQERSAGLESDSDCDIDVQTVDSH